MWRSSRRATSTKHGWRHTHVEGVLATQQTTKWSGISPDPGEGQPLLLLWLTVPARGRRSQAFGSAPMRHCTATAAKAGALGVLGAGAQAACQPDEHDKRGKTPSGALGMGWCVPAEAVMMAQLHQAQWCCASYRQAVAGMLPDSEACRRHTPVVLGTMLSCTRGSCCIRGRLWLLTLPHQRTPVHTPLAASLCLRLCFLVIPV